MAPLDMKPNELESYWLPFTPNRAFKRRPRLFSGAKNMHYLTPDGRKVIDASSGLFCVNAGHTRQPIVEAIQNAATKEGIQVDVETRAKHFYSIYNKMKKRGKKIDEIYDLLGIRVLCGTE